MAQITERMVAFGSENALYGFEGASSTFKRAQGTRGKPAHGGIAQLVEHLLCKQGVIGSNPFTSTIREDGRGSRAGIVETRAHSSAG